MPYLRLSDDRRRASSWPEWTTKPGALPFVFRLLRHDARGMEHPFWQHSCSFPANLSLHVLSRNSLTASSPPRN